MDDTGPLDTGDGMGTTERDDPGCEVLCDWEIQTQIGLYLRFSGFIIMVKCRKLPDQHRRYEDGIEQRVS